MVEASTNERKIIAEENLLKSDPETQPFSKLLWIVNSEAAKVTIGGRGYDDVEEIRKNAVKYFCDQGITPFYAGSYLEGVPETQKKQQVQSEGDYFESLFFLPARWAQIMLGKLQLSEQGAGILFFNYSITLKSKIKAMFFFIYKGRKFQSKDQFQKILDTATALTEVIPKNPIQSVKNGYDIDKEISKGKKTQSSLEEELKTLLGSENFGSRIKYIEAFCEFPSASENYWEFASDEGFLIEGGFDSTEQLHLKVFMRPETANLITCEAIANKVHLIDHQSNFYKVRNFLQSTACEKQKTNSGKTSKSKCDLEFYTQPCYNLEGNRECLKETEMFEDVSIEEYKQFASAVENWEGKAAGLSITKEIQKKAIDFSTYFMKGLYCRGAHKNCRSYPEEIKKLEIPKVDEVFGTGKKSGK